MFKNIVYVIIVAVFVFAYLRYFEHKSLYFPTEEIEFTPDAAGLEYKDVFINTDDNVKINAWFVPAENSEFTFLFCHGNGGNIGHRIDKINVLNKLGVDIFIFDYRGYGKSAGRPSEKGFYKDAKAVYDYLVNEKKIPPLRIIPYGESLGGAVAVKLASEKKVKALITESAFSSTRDMAKVLYPVFPSFVIYSKFDSAGRIKNITVPKLIIHSKGDEIVPFELSLKLFRAAKEPKKHLVLKGDHNSSYQDSGDLYVSGIRDFLKGL